jgi:hypothetical protein
LNLNLLISTGYILANKLHVKRIHLKKEGDIIMKKLALTLIVLTTILSFALTASATVILSQPRVMPGGSGTVPPSPFNDAEVNECPNNICVLAENFVMPFPGSITEVKIWGGYWHGSEPPATEIFNMIFHNDSGGSIGTSVADPSFSFNRSNIGTIIQQWWGGTTTTTEFEYTFTLDTPVSLGMGTYWIEIYGDTTGYSSSNDFFSRWGNLDPINGIDGLAWTTASAPGTNWQYDTTGNIAIEITAVPEPGTLLLLGSGFMGLAFYGRRKFRK